MYSETACGIKTEGDSKLTMIVPGTNHDLNPRRKMNAPRLLKRVAGDFTVQVKVTSDFTPGDTSTGKGKPFNGAGLVVWENEDNFLRLERNAYWVMGSLFCYPPLIEHWRDGKYAGVNAGPVLAEDFFEGRSTWLKLQRQGKRMTASMSDDGEEWTFTKEFSVDFPEDVSVGIQALNTSDATFTVDFEEFQLRGQEGATCDEAAGEVDEDLAADLALLQGSWELLHGNEGKGPPNTRSVKTIEGNTETLRRYGIKSGKLNHEHSVEFKLSKSGAVRVFTFYPVGGSPEHGGSYVYQVDKDNFYDIPGLLHGEQYRNYQSRPRVWHWKRVAEEASGATATSSESGDRPSKRPAD